MAALTLLELTYPNPNHLSLEEVCHKELLAAQGILTRISAQEFRGESLLEAYNLMSAHLDKASSLSRLMSQVHPEAEVRAQADRCEQAAHKLATEISLNRGLYEAFKDLDLSSFDDETMRLQRKVLGDFRRAGVDKDDATRAKIKNLQEELVLISQDFGRNIREDVRYIEISRAQLAGLPQDYREAREKSDAEKIRITTDYPDYIPFMTYAEDESARQELWMQFQNRAHPKNQDVLRRMIQKRYELAQVLGYASFADFIVENKMIKSTKNVAEFIEKVTQIATQAADQEYEKLLSVKRQKHSDATELLGFERAYLEEQYKKEHLAFNSQAVRPYFQFEKVVKGLLDLTSELFDLSYTKLEQAELWHPSVRAYDVFFQTQHLGRIFLDLHPRAHKFKHAAHFAVQSGLKGHNIPQSALVCNFADPSVTQPALMDHDQVVTFFHEFGHLLHHILGGHQKWLEFSGVATEWDFVEAPSQLFEEWAWDPQVLSRFAYHFETGEPIAESLVHRMRAAREFGKGLDARQQIFYAALSLEYYLRKPDNLDVDALFRELHNRYSKFRYTPNTHFNLNFAHLSGYSAMYYTYMWSYVIAKDLLSPFATVGLMNLKVARRYKDCILAKGGSRDAADLVSDFLGRDYSFDAFQKWIEAQS